MAIRNSENKNVTNQYFYDSTMRKCVVSFYNYQQAAKIEIYQPKLRKWESLNAFQKKLIPWYPDYLDELLYCIGENAKFLQEVARFACKDWVANLDEEIKEWPDASIIETSNAFSSITQTCREWSGYCNFEREFLLSRIISTIGKTFTRVDSNDISILNPGCGSGRLIADLIDRGYSSSGIENSFSMIMISMYILNNNIPLNSVILFPYIHQASHLAQRSDQLLGISIPDFDTMTLLERTNTMSIGYGSFINCFGPNENINCSSEYSCNQDMIIERAKLQESQDIIVTNFFIDTAPNILNYLQSIDHCLKTNGVWINYGPLLYHFEKDCVTQPENEFDIYTGRIFNEKFNVPLQGLELTAKEIIQLMQNQFNYKLLQYDDDLKSSYGGNRGPSGLPGYKCYFWCLMKLG